MFQIHNNLVFVNPNGTPFEELPTFDQRWIEHQRELQEKTMAYLEQRAIKKQIDSMVYTAIEKSFQNISK